MVINYLENLLGRPQVTSKGDEYHWDCPLCGDRRKRLYVNVNTHSAWCFNCEFRGSIISLISAIEGISFKEALEIYKSHHGVFQMPEQIKDEVIQKINKVSYSRYFSKVPVDLPDDYTELDGSDSITGKMIYKYLKKRGVTDEQIRTHRFGFCYEGRYRKRAILPIFEQGELRYWVARAIEKKAQLKELSPVVESNQFGKSEVIFNVDRASILFNSLVLAEGIFDALTFGDVGCSILGHHLSNAQLEVLLGYKDYLTDGIYIAMDEDAWRDSIEMAEMLFQYFPVYLCRVTGDPNEMGRRGCLELIKNAVEFSPLTRVKLIN